jgi:hypothetical protein
LTSRAPLTVFVCQAYLRIFVVFPYPHAAQHLVFTPYARLPQRLHLMWTTLWERRPIEDVPLPVFPI